MNTNEKTINVLNDLIQLNNDRMQGYDLAAEQTNDNDLKNIFSDYSTTSRQFKNDIALKVKSLGGEAEQGTSTSGKVYRAWMDVKTALTSNDRKTTLNSCEFGEDAAVRGYESAMKEVSDLSTDVSTMVSTQYSTIKKHHDKIKSMRDQVSS